MTLIAGIDRVGSPSADPHLFKERQHAFQRYIPIDEYLYTYQMKGI